MKLPQVKSSFVWIVLLCGLISFVFMLGNLTLLGLKRYPDTPYKNLADAQIFEGRRALITYGCGSCHVIPGIRGARGRVGPKLEDIHQQMFLGGMLINDMEGIILWIQHPQKISPHTAMPDLGVSDEEAKSMAAYLYELSKGRPWA